MYLMKVVFTFLLLFLLSQRLVAQYCLLPDIENLYLTHESECQTTLHWDSVPGALFYGVKYRLTIDTSWMLVPSIVHETFYSFSGLNPITDYTFAARVICPDSLPGGWV